jgi:hypothetical protein
VLFSYNIKLSYQCILYENITTYFYFEKHAMTFLLYGKKVSKVMKTVFDFLKIVPDPCPSLLFNWKLMYSNNVSTIKNQFCKVSWTASFLGSNVGQKIICEKSNIYINFKNKEKTNIPSKKVSNHENRWKNALFTVNYVI